jgi:2-dehydro-3-deoxygluconokinase
MKKGKIVTLGEIMLRLSTPGFERFTQTKSFDIEYGGSEANVAVSLAQLGMEAEHITRFPDNDLGKAATQQLQRMVPLVGHNTRHIKRRGRSLRGGH